MAPRTKEQQIAYNLKRRQESAEKRPAPKAKNTSRAMREAKAIHNIAAQIKTLGADSLLPQTKTVVTRKSPASRKGQQARLTSAKKRKAELEVGPAPAMEERTQAAATPAAILPPVPGTPPEHTMARSYVRSGAPGLGKLRGKTYQVTVSFTEEQMRQVGAAAQFRVVSLAEMIRLCVVAHLNTKAVV